MEYEKFFNGARETPPQDLRDEIRSEIRGLRNANLRGHADNWRLSQLEARFTSLSELFGRRLRRQEEGAAPQAVGAGTRRPDPSRGIVLGSELASDGVEALYAGLAAGGDRPGFDLESFRAYLGRQVRSIRDRTGCTQVRFRLEPVGDKLKLKAKPLGAADR